jgi:hypothetical protein
MMGIKRGGCVIAALTLLSMAPAGAAQERIEGKVVGTKLTHCEMNVKIGGCAGTLTLQHTGERGREELKFTVRLGTPITRGAETMYLPALRGKTVAVTQAVEGGERIAKAIEVPN